MKEQKEQKEQAELSASQVDTGKFGSVEELLAAYTALEREFTRRCQALKRLEAELEKARAASPAEEQIDDVCSLADTEEKCAEGGSADTPAVRSSADGESIEDALALVIAHIDECAEKIAELAPVTDACIARYKQKLMSFGGLASPQGVAVVTPVKRPKTLAEAKRLADEMLK